MASSDDSTPFSPSDLSHTVTHSLSPTERATFQLIRDTCIQQFPNHPPVEARVAGGWVRDKILGVTSHDIDVALTVPGVTFAHAINAQLALRGIRPCKIGRIAAQPEKGKHLETATIHLPDGVFVDLTNLRPPYAACLPAEAPQEQGAAHGPEKVAMGTPLDDALRRDLTINSLFYNINTWQLEDCTALGIGDLLHRRLIRTPVSPMATFHDDPLRVLRAIRFAERFRFSLADELVAAARSPMVRERLAIVSRERFGTEIDALCRARDPFHAFHLLFHLDLFQLIFLDTIPLPVVSSPESSHLSRAHGVLSQFFAHDSLSFAPCLTALHLYLRVAHVQFFAVDAPPTHLKSALLAIMLLPLHLYFDSARLFIAESHLRPSLLLSNHEIKDILTLHRHHHPIFNLFMEFYHFISTSPSSSTTSSSTTTSSTSIVQDHLQDDDMIQSSSSSSTTDSLEPLSLSFLNDPQRRTHFRQEIGMAFRELGTHLWIDALRFCWVRYELLQPHPDLLSFDSIKDISFGEDTIDPTYDAAGVHTFHQFLLLIKRERLDQVFQLKPLIPGNELCDLLGIPRGPRIATLLTQEMKWMLAHPSHLEDQQGCLDHLKTLI